MQGADKHPFPDFHYLRDHTRDTHFTFGQVPVFALPSFFGFLKQVSLGPWLLYLRLLFIVSVVRTLTRGPGHMFNQRMRRPQSIDRECCFEQGNTCVRRVP